MFPKRQRISRPLFKTVLRDGRRAASRLFFVRFTLSPAAPAARFSVVVPKKNVRTAAARNRFRRRLYAALRSLEPELSGVAALAVFSRAAPGNATASALRAELAQLLRRAGALGTSSRPAASGGTA